MLGMLNLQESMFKYESLVGLVGLNQKDFYKNII